MPKTTPLPSFADRLECVANGKRTTRAELEDLAEFAAEITEWANELDTKAADFAAEVEMYHDPDTPRADLANVRERMVANAESAAGALRAILQYGEPGIAPRVTA